MNKSPRFVANTNQEVLGLSIFSQIQICGLIIRQPEDLFDHSISQPSFFTLVSQDFTLAAALFDSCEIAGCWLAGFGICWPA